MADINIYGTLNNATPEGVIARAEQIKDVELDKKQSVINKEINTKLGELEQGIGDITIDTVDVSVDQTIGEASGTGSVSGKTLTLSFSGIKGEQGEQGTPGVNATITNATATIGTGTESTPSVEVTLGGTESARTFEFHFDNLKGEQGEGAVLEDFLSLESENGVQNKVIAQRIFDIEDVVFPLTLSVSGGGTFEKGTSRDITVTWTIKKGNEVVTADSQTINGEPVEGNSKKFTGVTETTTYTVSITKGGKNKTGSTKATFVAPMYFGFNETDNASSLDITSLTKQSIKTSPGGTYTINNPTSGYYLWLCVPSSMNINKVTSSGFDVPMEPQQSGSTSIDTYKCYRSSSSIVDGNMTITIS